MSGNIEDDLFYDLFGDDGFLTPESAGSTDQDSGHGSPFESNFDASPQQSFGWETTDHHVGEFWGSILDDLPSDITDDSDSSDPQPLHFESYKSPLSLSSSDQSEPLLWSTKIMNEASFDCNSNVNEDWNFNENPLDTIKDGSLNCVSMDNNNSSYSITIPIKPELSLSNNDVLNGNEIQVQSTPSIVIKPASAKKGPTWVVKTSDIKSHFQIGQNIVAIIQNVNANNNPEEIPPDIHSICNELNNATKTMYPVVNTDMQEDMVSHVNHIDHDYADTDMMTATMETTGVSKGMGPGLILTDEEKKLLEMESLKLPEDAPLTKEEEKVLKKVRRKIKNKQSAMESRRKRKEYIENLERRVKHCTDLNHGLRKKVDKLTKDNKSLVSQLKTMKEFIAVSFQQNRAAGTGTCLAVLLLSFALFVLPLNPLYYEGKSDNNIAAETTNPNSVFRSRTLLAIEDNTDYVYHDNELFNYINESYMYTDDTKVDFDNFRNDYVSKANISMYMHHNLTWHGMLNDQQTDHYVNS